MKTIDTVKKGDYVEIYNPDEMVKAFLTEKLFYPIDINHLRVMCRISSGKKYLVMGVCKRCKSLTIKVGKYRPSIRYRHISKVS
jgi:hypothetical protein